MAHEGDEWLQNLLKFPLDAANSADDVEGLSTSISGPGALSLLTSVNAQSLETRRTNVSQPATSSSIASTKAEKKTGEKDERRDREGVKELLQQVEYKGKKYIGPTKSNRPNYKSKQNWEWEIYPHGISRQNDKLRVQIKQKGFNPTYPSFPYTLEGLKDAAMFRDHEAHRLWQAGILSRIPKFNFYHPDFSMKRIAEVEHDATSSSSRSQQKRKNSSSTSQTEGGNDKKLKNKDKPGLQKKDENKDKPVLQNKDKPDFPFSSAAEYDKFLNYAAESQMASGRQPLPAHEEFEPVGGVWGDDDLD
eukprot:CAMPEP_0167794088 /NCGR_PEP_ID=MMETSP0111_2-20121227/13604_1 /TAXON_ID=91324 /ORGANISM="Lotharella globosa, Strain CCCM811" /LENGTH=304 /DNA_ID=CAMNT_0007687443 /DNA_START=136 /DNA_END=1050 /DNA_ORIENTATION=+